MKVIKRDGKSALYDPEKIRIAINKANVCVPEEERVSKRQIESIIKYIESLNKKRILVEDIQDLIEEKLMSLGKYRLSKEYITYRYTRALVRKANTTDESILSLMRRENLDDFQNKELILAKNQRNFIAGAISKDLSKRILLPEKIRKAHEEGLLYFHDLDYFVQPIINCSEPNIEVMLEQGFTLNNLTIDPPHNFVEASLLITEIIANLIDNQSGGISINLSNLGKYLKKSEEQIKKTHHNEADLSEELHKGIAILTYQNNALYHEKDVVFFLNLLKDDPFLSYNALIFEEVLKSQSLKIVYVLTEENNLKGGKFDYLTKLIVNRPQTILLSSNLMKQNYQGQVFSPMGSTHFLLPWQDEQGNYQFEGRFLQGVVSLNLPSIALAASQVEDMFWPLLKERLELCKEALMCKHEALLGTVSDTSPLHFQSGAIGHLKEREKIDQYLNTSYTTLSLGFVGLEELVYLMKNMSFANKEGLTFALKVISSIEETLTLWKEETNLGFVLCAPDEAYVGQYFVKCDQEKYGKIKNVTDHDYYLPGFAFKDFESQNLEQRLIWESKFNSMVLGGQKISINWAEVNNFSEFISLVYQNMIAVDCQIKENNNEK